MDQTVGRIRNGYFTAAAGWLLVAVAAGAAGAPAPVFVLFLSCTLVTAAWGIWWFQRVDAAIRSQVPRQVLVTTSPHRLGLTRVTVSLLGSDRQLTFLTRTRGSAIGEAMTLYGNPHTHLMAVAGTRHTFVALLPRPAEGATPLRKDTSRTLSDGRRIRATPSNRPDIDSFRRRSDSD